MKQIGVQGVLELLATKMNNFQSQTEGAAASMNKLADAAERLAAAQGLDTSGLGEYSSANASKNLTAFHTGGIVGESGGQAHSGPLLSNEVPAILQSGETILSNKHSKADINRIVDYLEDTPINMFMNGSMALGEIAGISSIAASQSGYSGIKGSVHDLVGAKSISRSLLAGAESIYNSTMGGLNFDNQINIAGNADMDVVREFQNSLNNLKDEIIKEIFQKQVNQQKQYLGLNYASRR